MGCFIKYIGTLCNATAWRASGDSLSFSSYHFLLEKQTEPRSIGAFCLGQVWLRKGTGSLDVRQQLYDACLKVWNHAENFLPDVDTWIHFPSICSFISYSNAATLAFI